MSSETRVSCPLTNCFYYSTKPPETDCYCQHPDKAHYMGGVSCPLYRARWTVSDEKSAELREKLVEMQKRARKFQRRKRP